MPTPHNINRFQIGLLDENDITPGSLTAQSLSASVVANGLTGGAGTPLAVNLDTNSGMFFTSGKLAIQAADASVSVASGGINVAYAAGGGIQLGTGGIEVDNTVVETLADPQTVTGIKTHSANIAMTGGATVTGLPMPSNPSDAASMSYVNSVVSGLDVKDSVDVATTAALPANTYNNGTGGVGATLTGNVNGAIPAIDGFTLTVGDRILVKDEVATENNGIYEVTQLGDGSNPYILTRATDFDETTEIVEGSFTFVTNGTVNSDTGWLMTATGTIVIGTTGLPWTQFSSAGTILAGDGLQKIGNTISVLPADDSIVATVSGTAVNPDAANAIQVTAGGVGVIAALNTGHMGSGTNLGTSASAGTTGRVANADHIHARDVYRQEKFTGITQTIGNPSTLNLTSSVLASAAGNTGTNGNNMLALYLNGVLLEQGGTTGGTGDYTISGSTITYNGGLAIASSDVFLALYYALS
jgi:hypothetical protein